MKDDMYYKSLQGDIISTLLDCKNVVRYEPEKFIEVKPGRKSPIHVNFKSTLSDVKLREKVADYMAYNMDKHKINYICGIESGGSYFASRASDILGLPLSLFRKEHKEYADKGRLVGADPKLGSTIAIVDDTLVTGKTIKPAIDYFKDFSDCINIYCILTYGLDTAIYKLLKISSIQNIFTIGDLIKEGITKSYFEDPAMSYIDSFIKEQKERMEAA